MILKLGNGREIEITGVSGEEDDVQVDGALYTDTGDDVSDEDLEEVYTYYPAELYEMWHDKQVAAGDALADQYKDGTYGD